MEYLRWNSKWMWGAAMCLATLQVEAHAKTPPVSPVSPSPDAGTTSWGEPVTLPSMVSVSTGAPTTCGCGGSSECAECGWTSDCDVCAPPCCPTWVVNKDLYFLNRKNNNEQVLVVSQNSGATMLSTRDFDDDLSTLPQLQIIHNDPCCNGHELTIFGTSFETEAFSGGSESPQYLAPGFPIPSTAPGTIFRTDYDTSIWSMELNYRRYFNPNLTWVAGFRWIELGDELRVDQVAPITRELFNIDTNNHLYGFQLGADANLWTQGRWAVRSVARGAILGNHADHTMDAPFLNGVNGFVDHLEASKSTTAFFGSLGLMGAYQVNSRLALRAGYQLMWLEGVALAPDQIPVNSFIAPGTSVLDTSGSLLLHGALIGSTFNF